MTDHGDHDHDHHHHDGPHDYVAAIQGYRAEQDEFFKTSAGSPIPPGDRDAFTGLPYYPGQRLPAHHLSLAQLRRHGSRHRRHRGRAALPVGAPGHRRHRRARHGGPDLLADRSARGQECQCVCRGCVHDVHRGAGVVYAPPESSSSTCRLPGSTPCSRIECRTAASSRSSATAFSRSRALLSVGHRFDDPERQPQPAQEPAPLPTVGFWVMDLGDVVACQFPHRTTTGRLTAHRKRKSPQLTRDQRIPVTPARKNAR